MHHCKSTPAVHIQIIKTNVVHMCNILVWLSKNQYQGWMQAAKIFTKLVTGHMCCFALLGVKLKCLCIDLDTEFNVYINIILF